MIRSLKNLKMINKHVGLHENLQNVFNKNASASSGYTDAKCKWTWNAGVNVKWWVLSFWSNIYAVHMVEHSYSIYTIARETTSNPLIIVSRDCGCVMFSVMSTIDVMVKREIEIRFLYWNFNSIDTNPVIGLTRSEDCPYINTCFELIEQIYTNVKLIINDRCTFCTDAWTDHQHFKKTSEPQPIFTYYSQMTHLWIR